MPEVKRYLPGQFCWMDLGTTDDRAATAFYSELFDWQTEVSPMEHGGTYTMLRKDDKDLGGIYKLMPEQLSQGVSPHWLSYVTVENASAAAEAAARLGGAVHMAPMDVMDTGRMAVLVDPGGAAFAVWQPTKHRGSQLVGEPGAPCWNELVTMDVESAGSFYGKLLGWTLAKQAIGPIEYTMAMCGEVPAAGLLAPPQDMGDVPPFWMLYFAVWDCEETVERARGLGGAVAAPPADVPGVGRMAALRDPQGATFSVIKLREETV